MSAVGERGLKLSAEAARRNRARHSQESLDPDFRRGHLALDSETENPSRDSAHRAGHTTW